MLNLKGIIFWTEAIIIASVLSGCTSVFAENYSISITTSEEVNLTTGADGIAIGSSNIHIMTTCRSGYNLTLATSVPDNNLYLNGNSANNVENSYVSPADGTTALANAPSTWGYLSTPTVPNANNVFLPVSANLLQPSIIKTTNETASDRDIDDTFAIYYASNAGNNQPGTYKMAPEDSSASPVVNGGLAYYLTASPDCNANLDINFNKNLDGEGGETGDEVNDFPDTTDNVKDLINHTYTLSDKYPTREGYIFKEWNTETDGSGNYYQPGAVIPIGTTGLTGTVTLYAIWVTDCQSGYICYDANHADEGTMSKQEATNGNTTKLIPTNYSRRGYGFAGWNTAPDGSGTQYGPQQTITMPSTGGLNLFAIWIQESGTFQAWSGASAMNTGEVKALRDIRDNQVYAVAKLADGKIWMIENLRLLPNTASLSLVNTNNPTQSFIQAAPQSASSTTQCATDDSECNDQINYYANNMDRSLNQSPTGNITTNAWYSYGVMYNWYTATAGHGTYDFDNHSGPNEDGTVAGDICPAGWHLPTGATSGEYNTLTNLLGGTTATGGNNLRAYPNNFIFSADFNPGKGIPDARGTQARLWSSTVTTNKAKSYRMGFNNANVITPTGSWNKWDNFAVRCIYQGGNIPYVDVDVEFAGHGITSITFYNETYGPLTVTPNRPVAHIIADAPYTITANTDTGYELKNWATTENGTLSDASANPTTYTVTDEATLTVIGRTVPAFSTTVTLPTNVTSISFTHPNYPTQTVTSSGETISLRENTEYSVTADFIDGYTVDHWLVGENATLSSTTSNPTTLTITDSTTLTLTVKEAILVNYTLHYDAGIGTGGPADDTGTSYHGYYDFTIASTVPFLFGYSFLGWSETSEATTATYVYDAHTSTFTPSTVRVTNPDPDSPTIDKTLYAVYSEDNCPSEQICYFDNGANSGIMNNQAASSNTETVLIPSNYAKTGYGFAGWLATPASGTTPELIYGPNATITTPDLSTSGMKLYAKWVPSSGSLQTWTGCSTLSVNEVIALTDTRDNETYAIAKLADGRCWMVENLRLVPSAVSITNDNTNSPIEGFAEAAASSSTSDNLCGILDDPECNDKIQYNTNSLNRSLTQSYNTAGKRVAWYSYGVYYNWYTATAGNGTVETGADVTVAGDICPTGWHLPTGNNGEYVTMNTAVNTGSEDVMLRDYPNNFIWSGDFNKTSRTNGGVNGRYWTSTSFSTGSAYRFGFQPGKMAVNGNYEKWDAFAIRCIYGNSTEASTPASTDNTSNSSPTENASPETNNPDTNNQASENTDTTQESTAIAQPQSASPAPTESTATPNNNATPINNTNAPIDNTNTSTEIANTTENTANTETANSTSASDSFASPQGVTDYTNESTETINDNTPFIIAAVATAATASTIGFFAYANRRNNNKRQ